MIGEPILVMLIEDNIDHAELVMRTLEEHRIANTVRHFLDGQSALDYLFRRGEFSDAAQKHQLPHVILLDLRLPRVDGIDVLKAIKEDPELEKYPGCRADHFRSRKRCRQSLLQPRQQLSGETGGI